MATYEKWVIFSFSFCPQPPHTVGEQKPSTAYSPMSPACSLPVRFDSPTMHNCITHHHTSLFNTSHPSHHRVWLKISSADGGRDHLMVISVQDCAHILFVLGNSCIVLKCRKVCERGCVVYVCGWVWAFMCVCRSVRIRDKGLCKWEEVNVLPACWT